MNNQKTRKGPLSHRVILWGFSALLSLLLIWLLGFVLSDIGKIEGPKRSELEDEYVDPVIRSERDRLTREENQLQERIRHLRENQELLQTSARTSQETLNQMLELQRRNAENDIAPTEADRQTIEESQELFLENQKLFEEANQQIAELNEQVRAIEQQREELKRQIDEQMAVANERFNELYFDHRFKIASLRMAFLIPLVALFAWLSFRWRQSPYIPLINAALFATLARTFFVMFEHFPREFFKYIAIVTLIVVVVAFLVYRIRLALKPLPGWLIQQYKDAYSRKQCPVCSYPIQQGPLKFALWTKRGPMPIRAGGEAAPEDFKPYTCPSCGTALYEHCSSCEAVRHSLLPFCDSCGAEKNLIDEQ